MTTLLIAGSRAANDAMLDYTAVIFRRAIELQWDIMVGDNPEGVDNAVVQLANLHEVPITVVGITPEPRNEGSKMGRYLQKSINQPTPYSRYIARDQWMIAHSDHAIFIWNGSSRGTERGYEYARTLGKACWLKQC